MFYLNFYLEKLIRNRMPSRNFFHERNGKTRIVVIPSHGKDVFFISLPACPISRICRF
jgi:hypothetical protein